MSLQEKKVEKLPRSESDDNIPIEGEILLNVSGHAQEVDRQLGFWSICAIGVVADNAWGAGGGALITALYNGGGPGVLYELIVATIFYVFIAAGLAELSSAIPSSANVYHWASVTAGPNWGPICSYYAGWWNALAWTFGTASASLVGANTIIAIYSLYHPDYSPERWQIFICFLGVSWSACGIVLFGQRALPLIANCSAFICLGGWLVTVMVCAIMPSQTGYGYASNSFVWSDWNNGTGYSSNGFVFVAGMLNGAYAIGTPDGVCHMAEEIPEPKKNIPKGIVAQLSTGFITTFTFYIAVLYAVTDFATVLDTNIVSLPLAAMFQQATRSNAGTTGLLVVFFLDITICVPGAFIAAGRMLWTLGRDDATPFSPWVGKISPTFKNQFNATLCCGVTCTLLGCIYIGSATAFNAFVGVFAIFTTLSYLAPLLPHIITKRKHVTPGPFWMPSKVAYPVIGLASAYIIVWNVIFMFPYALPTSANSMNYSCVMSGGLTIILGIFYAWKRSHGYIGPQLILDASDDIIKGVVLTNEEMVQDRRHSSVTRTTMGGGRRFRPDEEGALHSQTRHPHVGRFYRRRADLEFGSAPALIVLGQRHAIRSGLKVKSDVVMRRWLRWRTNSIAVPPSEVGRRHSRRLSKMAKSAIAVGAVALFSFATLSLAGTTTQSRPVSWPATGTVSVLRSGSSYSASMTHTRPGSATASDSTFSIPTAATANPTQTGVAIDNGTAYINYSTVGGYFLQDLNSTNASTFDYTAVNFGLINQTYSGYDCSTTTNLTQWERFDRVLYALNQAAASNVVYKLLFIGRHGEGYHNAAQTFYGTPAWNCYYAELSGNSTTTWADAHLDNVGVSQAIEANLFWAHEMSTQHIQPPQSYYVSPLSRCLETANYTYSNLSLPAYYPFIPTVKELFRESISVHTCDHRSNRTYIAASFPTYKIDASLTEYDELWNGITAETNSAQDYRSKIALDDVFAADPAQIVSITTHSGEAGSLLRVLGHIPFSLNTGAIIPVLVRAETVDAPPSATTTSAWTTSAWCTNGPPLSSQTTGSDACVCSGGVSPVAAKPTGTITQTS